MLRDVRVIALNSKEKALKGVQNEVQLNRNWEASESRPCTILDYLALCRECTGR